MLVLLIAAAVSGCGRRGRLEPPPDPNAPPAEETNKAGIHKRKPNPPIRAPDRPFVLDPLLQ